MAKTIEIEIEDELAKGAMRHTGAANEREAVERILRSYLAALEAHRDLVDLSGKIEFHEGFDPKDLRENRGIPG